jgi:hypothetical protein
MKKLVISIVAILLLCALSPIHAEVIGDNNETVKKIADPILDNILDAMKTKDYAKYTKDFNGKMKEAIPEKDFTATNDKLLKDMGDNVSKEYLGFLTVQNLTVALYKGKFTVSKDDILIKLVLTKENDKVIVTGLWFQ